MQDNCYYYEDENYSYEKFFSLKPHSGTLFTRVSSLKVWDEKPNQKIKLPTDLDPKGKVSAKAKSKIKNAVNWMVELSENKKVMHPTKRDLNGKPLEFEFRLSFATFTIPCEQEHTDDTILKKCFLPMLRKLSSKYGRKIKKTYKRRTIGYFKNKKRFSKRSVKVKKAGYKYMFNYIWRAEQQDNGNIHFHVLLDTFIHYNDLRLIWNSQIAKLGYIDRYERKMKDFHNDGVNYRFDLMKERNDGKHNVKKIWTIEQQNEAYEKGLRSNWRDPNTTDIHKVNKINDIAAYLVKYMTKGRNKRYKINELQALPVLEKKQIKGRKLHKTEKYEGLNLRENNEYSMLKLHSKMIAKGDLTCLQFSKMTPEAYSQRISKRLAELERKFITCRLWDCAQPLERLKLCLSVEGDNIETDMTTILKSPQYIQKKEILDAAFEAEIELKKQKGLYMDGDERKYYDVIPFKVNELRAMNLKRIVEIYDYFIQLIKADWAEGTYERQDLFKNRHNIKQIKNIYDSKVIPINKQAVQTALNLAA